MVKRKPTQVKGPSSPEAIAMRRLVRGSDVQNLESVTLPEEDYGDRQHLIFYQEDGGIRATNEENKNMDQIYYLGIIDILTPYNTLKKMEHCWKGLSADIVSFARCFPLSVRVKLMAMSSTKLVLYLPQNMPIGSSLSCRLSCEAVVVVRSSSQNKLPLLSARARAELRCIYADAPRTTARTLHAPLPPPLLPEDVLPRPPNSICSKYTHLVNLAPMDFYHLSAPPRSKMVF